MKRNEDSKYEIKEFIASVSQPNPKHNWCKAILSTLINDEDMVDIRNFETNKNILGKGISLSNEEVNNLVDILIEKGFGSYDMLKKAVDEREKLFK